MKPYIEAQPRFGPRPSGARPLAGSRFTWFTDAEGATTEDLARLSVLRPPIAGLILDQPRIMGILNVTPDSFSDGGDHTSLEAAVLRAREVAEDADILDIGGESTRPGAETVAADEEIARTAPVIQAIRAAGITTPISIDTRKAPVAEAALEAGANIVNDVSAMTFDPDIAAVVAARGVPVCLMHARGDPKTMQNDPTYKDVVTEVAAFLEARIAAAQEAGIDRDKIIADPGIGFGKTLQHNVSILRHLSVYHDLGVPLLLGASRKRFIGTLGQADAAKERMPGSVAVALHGALHGAQILRVHDVKETRQALRLHMAMNEAE